MCVGCLPPLVRQTRSLGAHHYCRSLCHGTVVVQTGVLKLRRKYPDSFGFKEAYGLRGGAHCRGNRENSSYGCTYEVGVVQIGTRVADDKSVRSGGITGPEHGTEVAWLFHALQYRYQGVVFEMKARQRVLYCLKHPYCALCPFPVGGFGIETGGQCEMSALRNGLLAYDVGAEKDAVRLVSGLDAMGYLPYALDRKQSAFAPLRGLLKQRDKSFELRIG